MKVNKLTTSGTSEQLTVSSAVFGAEVNQVLLSQAVRVYLANQRQGTSKVKTRSEINRTKKKWFKQKGTGNARHGARTANIFVGGGVSHGPTGIQDWSLNLPARMKRQALASALSAQAKHVFVAEGFSALKGKTAQGVKFLGSVLKADQLVLVITEDTNQTILKSLRNLPQVLVMTAGRVTALEVAMADAIVMSEAAITVLEKRVATPDKAPKTKAKVAQTEVKAVEVKPAKAEKAPAAKKATPAKKAAPKTTTVKKVAKK